MTPDRLRRIADLALPIIGGMISQNVLNLVDTAMVGVLGSAPLAAVGIAGFTTFMATAVVMGFSSGVQTMAARRIGEGRHQESAVPLTGGLALALVVGLPLSLALVALAPVLLPLVNSDPAVIREGLPYFEWRLIGLVAVGFNFCFRGYWAGVSRTRIYLYTLLTIHVANVAISYVLIFGKLGLPALGTAGAGMGTTLALLLGSAMHFVLALRLARGHGFLSRLPRRQTMLTMLRLSLPAALQQFLFAAGLTVFFVIIGRIGTDELAISNVILNLMLVAILPGMALGIAALTLVGEALGRKQIDDATRWGWQVSGLASVLMALLGLPALLAPGLLLSGFAHEAALIALGETSLRLVGVLVALDGVGLVLMHALLGAGAARQVMVVAVVTQWAIGLPLAWLVGPVLGLGLTAAWLSLAGYRILQTAVFAILWRRGAWSKIRL
ncbi:MAG: MATE family efflux transporter [Alphaproteobacteria bacterium]|jgi:putative MATE family efflux protein|nr:MATE family efflux transporter [Alphaproteobacteria bacterium]HJP21553.1 MATE family efflux transporter [Alphaproteobacteria bacterium]